jgi:Putative MetA-pathway of phenol degradation
LKTHDLLRVVRALALALSMSAIGTLACADDGSDAGSEGPPITPYRPTVSDPAQLPAPGQLELELGGQRTSGSGSSRSSPPYLLKLAFNEQWGLLVGGDAYVWQQQDGGRAEGSGDTSLTLKRAWIVDSATAFGMELEVKLPTANDVIGSGKADYTMTGIYSRDFGPVHMDANLGATQLGQNDPGAARTQFNAATAFSTALAGKFGVTGEVSGTHRNGADASLQFLVALTYSPTKRLQFDLGVARTVKSNPATNSVFAGMVLPLARLW